MEHSLIGLQSILVFLFATFQHPWPSHCGSRLTPMSFPVRVTRPFGAGSWNHGDPAFQLGTSCEIWLGLQKQRHLLRGQQEKIVSFKSLSIYKTHMKIRQLSKKTLTIDRYADTHTPQSNTSIYRHKQIHERQCCLAAAEISMTWCYISRQVKARSTSSSNCPPVLSFSLTNLIRWSSAGGVVNVRGCKGRVFHNLTQTPG